MRRFRRLAGPSGLVLVAAFATVLAFPATAKPPTRDSEVTVGSDDGIFSQNKQNEPAVAIDPSHPFLVAAGANDNIDLEACEAGTPDTCPFTPGVGVSGVQFSFDSGEEWMQPEYTGFSARDECLGDPDPEVTTDVCVPDPAGPIGTLPGYGADAGLVSNGDPALAFGPVPDGSGNFSWDNGSRLYYANLASHFPGTDAFRGFVAIGVSRLDFPAALDDDAAEDVVNQGKWMSPVVASKQSSTTFSDKEQVWVDPNDDSPFFGNAYVCWASFRSLSSGNALPTPLIVARSTDGGDTWTEKQVTDATNNPFNPKKGFGRSGCTIRTDAAGVVYVFANQFAVGTPGSGKHVMIRSFDGGESWTRPVELFTAVDACFAVQFDGAGFRCVMDGVGGARDDLASSPSLDVSFGTGFLYDTWVDGSTGDDGPPVDNQTQLRLAFAHADEAGSPAGWTNSEVPIEDGDRPYYSALAVSPDGEDLYLVYNAFTNGYRNDTTSDRGLVGVILHADVDTTTGAPIEWEELHRGKEGDPRGSAQNNIVLEFLGDYVYADATDEFGVAVWNDVREAKTCEEVDAWRADVQEDGPPLDTSERPEIQQVCDPTFGNSDIWGWADEDPS